MKPLKFFIALTVCATVMASCNKNAMLNSAQDAEQKGIARSPGGKYSDYIISLQEAMDMVADDLKESGGKFAQKQVSYAQPVILGEITVNMEVWDMIFEKELFKREDPAFYIVHFEGEEEGFGIVFPDKRLGAEIMHVQTFGDMSAEDLYNAAEVYEGIKPPGMDPNYPTNPDWHGKTAIDWLVDNQVGYIHSIGEDIAQDDYKNLKLDPNGIHGNDEWDYWYHTNWQTIKTNDSQANFWVASGFPLNYYAVQQFQGYNLGMIAPTVTEFLGFFGGEKTYFGTTGNWDEIISDLNSYQVNSVAGYWAYEISNFCRVYTSFEPVESFGRIVPLLKNECGYSSANIQLYTYDMYQMENTDLSKILKDKKPVIISCGVPALAYKEDIEQRYYHYNSGNDNGVRF